MTRTQQMIVGAIVVIFAFFSLTAEVFAQDAGQSIIGQLRADDADGNKQPVVGVTLTVDGVGDGVSDEEGKWEIPVDSAGTYTISIDPSTLPEGISLKDADRASLDVLVEANKDKRALFSLVSGDAPVEEKTSGGVSTRRVAQLTVEGLKQGLYLAMAAIGLSLIFGTTGLVNFAHAELVTWGQLCTFLFNAYGFAGFIGWLAPLPPPFGDGVNLIVAAIFGMVGGALMGYFLDRFMFRRFRKRGLSLIAQMVITIGLSIFMRYIFVYNFGGSPRSFKDYSAQTAWTIWKVDITPKDFAAMVISLAALLAVGFLLNFTRIGKAMRAVADNRDLAESSGIDVNRVISVVWLAGGALAALGGVFFGLDQIKWDFGFRILLLIFAAVTLGGLGTAYGALIGALVTGLVINLATLWIDVELKNMIAMLVMVLILMFRPQGILGQPERIG